MRKFHFIFTLLLLSITLTLPYRGFALPAGADVVAGQAQIQNSLNKLTVENSRNAIVNWQSFSIAAGETTHFLQPDATSAVLNRVVGNNLSEIYGTLSSNGRVLLVNPGGVLIGNTGIINTNGFLASTLDVGNTAFLNGSELLFKGDSAASVTNLGTIQGGSGDVFLIARNVTNQGTINAPQGTAGLYAGQEMLLTPSGDDRRGYVRVSQKTANESATNTTGIDNSGTITAVRAELEAAGGNVYALAINNGGTIQATGTETRKGVVHFTANGGSIRNQTTGKITAKNANGSGGTVVLQGKRNDIPSIQKPNTVVTQSAPVATTTPQPAANAFSPEAAALLAQWEAEAVTTVATTGQKTVSTVTNVGVISADSATTVSSASGGSVHVEADFVAMGGTVSANGTGDGGKIAVKANSLSLADTISAQGTSGNGGAVDIQVAGSTIETSSSHINVSGANGGTIRHVAGNRIASSGNYKAIGTQGEGGEIDMTAPDIKLLSAQMDASGKVTGGVIRIGGEYQGGKHLVIDELLNAQTVGITNGAKIRADGETGGTIIVWSEQKSTVMGTFSAKGADFNNVNSTLAKSGLIEISSAGKVQTAVIPTTGNFLLDPKNITIADVAAANYSLIIGIGYPNSPVAAGHSVENNDRLGTAVSLDGTRLAIGTPYDDGFQNTTSDSGAVYLFSFTDSVFSGGTLEAIIGKGYTGGKNVNVTTLQASDLFGSSVSLKGTQLAIGAIGDDGFTNTVSNSGAVYVLSFTDATFNGAVLEATHGNGYTGGKNLNIATLEASDNFGSAVSLDTNRLAVGAWQDRGSGNTALNSGAVYLISFTDAVFSTPVLEATLGKGYTGGKNVDVTALESGDGFGTSVSLEGNRLAVGAPSDGGLGNVLTESGAVYLFSFADASFNTGTVSAVIGSGYTGGDNFNHTALESSDFFGTGVSLSGTQLAVGASGDGGAGNSVPSSGAVYLFTFANGTTFTGTTLQATVGSGYTGGNNVHLTNLASGDLFGTSVSINGNNLAAGAIFDDASGNVSTNSGAVYLLAFSSATWTGGTVQGTVGNAYSGGKNLSIWGAGLEVADYFGSSVSLNAAGDRLAVGVIEGAGYGNVASGSGEVYLFSFTDTNFSGGALEAILGKGYTGGKNVDVSGLEAGDNFGFSVSFNAAGDRLAVGAWFGNGNGNVNTGSGEVYLLSFTDTSFSGGSLEGIIGSGYSGGKNINVSTLDSFDIFGSGVSLNGTGDRLAVGAQWGDGLGNVASDSGELYLFSFTDNSFSGGSLEAMIGKGYTGGKNVDMNSLDDEDFFGFTPSFNAVGDRLAVGAWKGDGFGNSVTDSGEVYLFSFTDNSFSGGNLEAMIGKGYTGGKNIDISILEGGDGIGSSVSLNAVGNALATGAYAGKGFDNSNIEIGEVYLFSFADNSFSGGNLEAMIGKGYTGSKDIDIAGLEAGDRFGSRISLNANGDRLAVGAFYGDGSGNVANLSGEVYLFAFADNNFNMGAYSPTNALFSTDASSNVTITPASLTAILNNGTAVTLQANNDITVSENIIANNPVGNGGALTLQAGRSILINANITTDNGNLNLYANDTLANGVVNAQRDAGAAVITMAVGTTLNAGTGLVTIELRDGAGKTNLTSGSITLRDITANKISARNIGTTAGSNIILNGTLTADSTGTAIVLDSDNFINNAGGTAMSVTNGRGLIYSTNPAGNTFGGLISGEKAIWGKTHITYAPASVTETGNRYIFSDTGAVTLTTTNVATKVYDGTVNVATAYTLSGEPLSAATYGNVFVNSADTDIWSTAPTITASKNAGTNTITASGGVVNSGYSLNFANTGTITITQKTLTITGLTAANKIYDGNTSATVSSWGTLSGLIGSDTVTLDTASTSFTFADKNVGTGKIVSIGSLALLGADAGNYVLNTVGSTADITPRSITISPHHGQNKIYGTTDPASFTYTVGGMGLVSSDLFTGALNRMAGENVGNYAIQQGSLDAGSNYTLTFTTADFAINKALLMIIADDKNRIYGETNPTLTASYSGFVNGETSAVLTTQVSLASPSDAFSSVGNYTITAEGASANNYDIAYTQGSLSVVARPITVTITTGQTKTYGSADPANFAHTLGAMGLVNGDTLSGNLNRTVGENAGAYPINQGTLAASTNYALTFNSTDFTITPASLLIKADDKVREFDKSDPPFTATWTGLVATDNMLDVAGSGGLNYTTSTTLQSPVGIYPSAISVKGAQGIKASNYTITYEPATMTIQPSTVINNEVNTVIKKPEIEEVISTISDNNNGQGNDVGGYDASNPGKLAEVADGKDKKNSNDAKENESKEGEDKKEDKETSVASNRSSEGQSSNKETTFDQILGKGDVAVLGAGQAGGAPPAAVFKEVLAPETRKELGGMLSQNKQAMADNMNATVPVIAVKGATFSLGAQGISPEAMNPNTFKDILGSDTKMDLSNALRK